MEQKLDAGQEISREDIISLIKANDNAAKRMGQRLCRPNRSNELRRSNSHRNKSENADARASVEQSISEIENLRNMFEKALSSSMETVKQARKSGESAKVDMGTLEENAGLGYTGKKMSMKETEGSEHGSSKENQRDSGSDERARTETEDRPRVPKEVGRNKGAVQEEPVWLRKKRIIEDDAAEYGVPLNFVDPENWPDKQKDNPAFTRDGQVFIREGITAETENQIVPHEANHVMRQLKFGAYLDFLSRVPDMIDTTTKSGQDLLNGAAEHRGIDLFEELTDEQVDILYDEVNAIVSGVAVKDIEGDVLENLREAFYDYDAYKTELKAIHQQFKSHRKSSDSGTRYSLKDNTAQKNTTDESGGDYSLKSYSKKQIDNWKSSKNIVVYQGEHQLIEFVKNAVAGKALHKKLYFGAISKSLAERIEQETGIDLEGFNCTLRASEVRKILHDHGDEKKESLRGQRAITKDDFLDIPKVVESADSIVLDNRLFEGKPVIHFVKNFNGRTTVTAYVSKKHLDLTVQTMFSGVKKGDLAIAADEQASANTPKANDSTVPINIIPRVDGNSNSQNSLKGEEEFRKEVNRIREEGKKAGKSALEVERDVSEYVGVQYTELIKEYGAIKKGEKAFRDIEVPKNSEEDRPVSQTVRTILEAEVTPAAASRVGDQDVKPKSLSEIVERIRHGLELISQADTFVAQKHGRVNFTRPCIFFVIS